jgi:hypothetical protein
MSQEQTDAVAKCRQSLAIIDNRAIAELHEDNATSIHHSITIVLRDISQKAYLVVA